VASRIGLLHARFGFRRKIRPSSKGGDTVAVTLEAELIEKDRRLHHPFEIGEKDVAEGGHL
jgi:hypothetical protein